MATEFCTDCGGALATGYSLDTDGRYVPTCDPCAHQRSHGYVPSRERRALADYGYGEHAASRERTAHQLARKASGKARSIARRSARRAPAGAR